MSRKLIATSPKAKMYNCVFENAVIYDGSGDRPYHGALAVADSMIVGVYDTPYISVETDQRVDVHGMALCPSFVDTHTHSDMLLLHEGTQYSSISQGVTTEILGQDGLGYAPMSNANLKDYTRYLHGLNGFFEDVSLDFSTSTDYLSRYAGRIGVNVAWLLPHCALRLETAGFSRRLLSRQELDKACCITRDVIRAGARGFSTGLSYFPGAFSNTEELVSICRAVAAEDGVYVTHLRTVFDGKPFDSVDEALTIARSTGVKLHFSHYRTGGKNIGHVERIMEKIDEGCREGLDITLELYPYPYGASYAAMFIPPWASDGGVDAIISRLNNPESFRKIANYIDDQFPTFDGLISYSAKDVSLMGRTFGEIARIKQESIGEIITELLRSENIALGFHDIEPKMTDEESDRFEQDVFELLSRPNYMVGSDATHIGTFPHPRAWGSFSRLLGLSRKWHYPLETLIQRMSSLPCKRFNIEKRGRIQKGYYADLVIFDPKIVSDMATVLQPRNSSIGIHAVMVNGVFAQLNSTPTNALAGCVL